MLALNIGIVVVKNAEKPTMSGLCSWIASMNFSGGDLDAEVDDVKARALEHDVNQVLADVVHVALHGAHEEGAHGLDAGFDHQRVAAPRARRPWRVPR